MISKELETKIDQFIADNKQNILNDIAKLVRFNSVSEETGDPAVPFGQGCKDVLDEALSICEGMGFAVKNYDYYAGSASIGDKEKEIGLLGHLDVVPSGHGWTHDPFDMIIKDGYIYGRGVSDDKGPTVLGLYAMKCLKELGVPLNYTYRMFMGCSEEKGMKDVPYYQAHEKMPVFAFTPDADFAVCIGEKGIMSFQVTAPTDKKTILSVSGGTASNAVCDETVVVLQGVSEADLGDYSKDRFTVETVAEGIRITAKGKTSHAAKPEDSLNATWLVFQLIQNLPQLSPLEAQAAKGIVSMLSDYNGVGIGMDCEDAVSGKLTHISGLVSSNDEGIVLDFNIRYPVTFKGADLIERMIPHVQNLGFRVHVEEDAQPSYRPADTLEVHALLSAHDAVTGTKGEPYTIGGGTYARHFPNAVAFGPHFEEMPNPAGEGKGGEHMPDECTSIDYAMKAVKIYIFALLNLNELSL